MSKPILCVDFDGVIHSYSSGWQGAANIPDPPVPGAMLWLERAIKYFDVVIYSSRSKETDGRNAMRNWIFQYGYNELSTQRATVLVEAITFAHEKPSAFLTIDDRVVRFDGDWLDVALDPEILRTFKPWNKK